MAYPKRIKAGSPNDVKRLDAEPETQEQKDPQRGECPACESPPFTRCRDTRGRVMKNPHVARVRAFPIA